MMRRCRYVWLILAGLLLAPGCDEGATAPEEGVPEDQLQFLMFPPDLQPLTTRDTSFWAVRGQDTEFVLRYQPEAGETEGEEFLTFRIRPDGLHRRPDGRLFADGDSIQIRVQVSTDRFLFDFEPSGLRFHPDSPARLEIEYERLGGDLDDDGDVDGDDADFERTMRVWKQEAPGELWYPVGSLIFEETDEIEGEIVSFTGFAVAV